MTDTAAIFERDRYVVLPSLLKEPQLGQFYRYAYLLDKNGKTAPGDVDAPSTPFASGDFMMDGLLASLRPEIERACGLALFPTFSFCRLYKRGDMLAKHRDRPSCEISATLCLGFEEGKSWPIWIESPRGTQSVTLAAGAAMLYRGGECAHWREVFEGQRQAQVFLFYVDQNGPCADWKFDKRASIDQFRPAAKT